MDSLPNCYFCGEDVYNLTMCTFCEQYLCKYHRKRCECLSIIMCDYCTARDCDECNKSWCSNCYNNGENIENKCLTCRDYFDN